MPIKTVHIAIVLIMAQPSAFGQLLNNITIEFGYNKSKVVNTKQVRSFEAQRLGRNYVLEIGQEISPISDNKNISIGYAISKKHHIRIRHAQNTLGSRLEGSLQITFPANSFRPALTNILPLDRNFTERPSTSLGIIYEYHIPFHDGNIVFGAGVEKQRNFVIWETLVLPGLRSRSYSLHSHFGYLSEPITFIQIHAKVFSTYYYSKKLQVYDRLINSAYIPIQIGIEVGFRINFRDVFHNAKKGNKRKRRLKKLKY